MTPDYLPYLKTLRRIPAPIILDMATREFNMGNGWSIGDKPTCLCGWALRDAVAFGMKGAAHRIFSDYGCADTFGGDGWSAIYAGVCDGHLPAIEEAFARCVAECAR